MVHALKMILRVKLCLKLWERKFSFQKEIKCEFNGKDTIVSMNSEICKIITIVESPNCTSCDMQLPYWLKTLKTIKDSIKSEIEFLMILNTPDTITARSELKTYAFNYPVAINVLSSFTEDNSLPARAANRTFLLDANNSITVIGNPAKNPRIRDVYINAIKQSGSR